MSDTSDTATRNQMPSPHPGTARGEAIERYVVSCRARIPSFVRRHYTLTGTLRLHRAALGADLWRAPLNTLLAVPAFMVHVAALALRRVGLARASRRLERLPTGVATTVEREVQRLVVTEVFALPARLRLRLDAGNPLAEMARRYARTRSAASELGVNVLMLITGALVFERMTPGSLSTGRTVAGALAEHTAIESFPLGTWAGELWYAQFPPSVSTLDVVLATAVTMIVVALVSTFVGVLTDPLQAATGLHRRRLERLVGALERRLQAANGEFRPRDAWLARLLDALDVARAAGPFG